MSTSQPTPKFRSQRLEEAGSIRGAARPLPCPVRAAYTSSWAADSTNARVRLKAELDRANEELLLLREEIRVKNARLARIDPHRRPHYSPMSEWPSCS